MNKLIKKLELIASEQNGFDPTDLSKSQQNIVWFIVKECLEACSRANEIRHFVPPTQEQVVLSCMREIRKHFGGC